MHKILLFGTGSRCAEAKKHLDYTKVKIIAYIDNDKTKQGNYFDDKLIISPSEINNYDYDFIIITSIFSQEIESQLLQLDIPKYKIFPYGIDYGTYSLSEQLNKIINSNEYELFITGLSFAYCGIDTESLNKKSVNLAFFSQDLFYDYQIAKKVINKTKSKIKYVLLGLSYYSFQYDLSKSINKDFCVSRYVGIVNSLHNYVISKNNNIDSSDNILDSIWYYKNFFTAKSLKEGFIAFKKQDNLLLEKNFCELSKSAKKIQGKDSAIQASNKNYPKTVIENTQILDDYLTLLKNNNIAPILVIFPTTKYFYNYFSKSLKDEFYKIINDLNLRYDFQIFDYFESNLFNEGDFMDSSHLNKNGSKKITELLNTKIDLIENTINY